MMDMSPKTPNPPAVEQTIAAGEPPTAESVKSEFLLEHSKEAMVAAIEIYNKPTIRYRNECTAILLVNSWELVLKALLVSNKQSIFAEINDPEIQARTIPWRKAWRKSQPFLPQSLANRATESNLDALAKYRDRAIHCYNSSDLGIFLYFIFQAAIANYRDLIKNTWNIDIADEMTWHLLPIAMKPPTDIVSHLGRATESSDNSVASRFLAEIKDQLNDLMMSDENVDRFLIRITVALESIKKIDDANVVVGIDGKAGGDDPSVVVRRQDPNQSHPFRQKDILARIEETGDKKLTSYVFQAIVWKYKLKTDIKYCWSASEGVLTRYSSATMKLIRTLSATEVEDAVAAYQDHCRKRRQARP